MYIGICLFILPIPAVAVQFCQDETTDLCYGGCISGYLRSTDMSMCKRFGCSMSVYCVSCLDRIDTGSTCTSCTAGYSSVTVSGSDGTEYLGCYKNTYNGFCSVLGAENCPNGCQINIDKTMDAPDANQYVWDCLPDTTVVEEKDESVHYKTSHVVVIVTTVVALAGIMTGILMFFFVC